MNKPSDEIQHPHILELALFVREAPTHYIAQFRCGGFLILGSCCVEHLQLMLRFDKREQLDYVHYVPWLTTSHTCELCDKSAAEHDRF